MTCSEHIDNLMHFYFLAFNYNAVALAPAYFLEIFFYKVFRLYTILIKKSFLFCLHNSCYFALPRFYVSV